MNEVIKKHKHELEKELTCTDRCGADSCHDAYILECTKCDATFSLDKKIQFTDNKGWDI